MKSGVTFLSFLATLSVVVAAMMLVGCFSGAVEARCPLASSVRPPYMCWKNYDHNEETFLKIDCRRKYIGIDPSKFEGCQRICTPYRECHGLTWIPKNSPYKDGKYCCFLKKKMNCSRLKWQLGRVTCSKFIFR